MRYGIFMNYKKRIEGSHPCWFYCFARCNQSLGMHSSWSHENNSVMSKYFLNCLFTYSIPSNVNNIAPLDLTTTKFNDTILELLLLLPKLSLLLFQLHAVRRRMDATSSIWTNALVILMIVTWSELCEIHHLWFDAIFWCLVAGGCWHWDVIGFEILN